MKISTGRSSIYLMLLFLLSFLFCVLSLSYLNSNQLGGDGWARSVSLTFLVWGAGYVILTSFHYKTLYLYSNAFLLCLAIFHLGLTLQMAFGLEVGGWSSGSFSGQLEKAAWLTNIAFFSFGMGLAICTIGLKSKYMQVEAVRQSTRINKATLYWSGVGMLVASGIFLSMSIASYGNIFQYARYEIFRSSADSRGWGLFTMTFPAATALMLFGAKNKKQLLIASVLVSVAVGFFMFIGYRSIALFALLAGTITWVKTGKKIPMLVAVTLLFLATISISISGYLRNTGAYSEIGVEDFKKSYQESSIKDVGSLGQTLGIVAHALSLVPEKFPYRYGGSYFLALRQSIPNIGLNIDSGTGRHAAKQNLQNDSLAIYKIAPSDWMTYEILRDQYDIGQGVGFSGVAEPYINFGIFGVIFIFMSIGFMLGRFDTRLLATNIFYLLFAICFYMQLLPIVRNDFSNFIKPSVFMIIILTIWWLGSASFLGKKFPWRKLN